VEALTWGWVEPSDINQEFDLSLRRLSMARGVLDGALSWFWGVGWFDGAGVDVADFYLF